MELDELIEKIKPIQPSKKIDKKDYWSQAGFDKEYPYLMKNLILSYHENDTLLQRINDTIINLSMWPQSMPVNPNKFFGLGKIDLTTRDGIHLFSGSLDLALDLYNKSLDPSMLECINSMEEFEYNVHNINWASWNHGNKRFSVKTIDLQNKDQSLTIIPEINSTLQYIQSIVLFPALLADSLYYYFHNIIEKNDKNRNSSTIMLNRNDFKKMIDDKKRYLARKNITRTEGFLIIPAVNTYFLNLAQTYHMTDDTKVRKCLNYFAQLEFDETSHSYRNYLSLFKNKTDVLSNIKKLFSKLPSDLHPDILSLLFEKKNREVISTIASPEVIGIIKNAYDNGWAQLLFDQIEYTRDSITDKKYSKALSLQKTGSLVLLLDEPHIQKKIIDISIDYDGLYRIREMDKTLFKKNIDFGSDHLFISNLIKLAHFSPQKYGDIDFNQDKIMFVKNVKNFNRRASSAVLWMLRNYDIAAKAFTFTECKEMDEHYAAWMKKNGLPLMQKISLRDKIDEYRAGIESSKLDKNLLSLSKSQDLVFMNKLVSDYSSYGVLAYERITGLFSQSIRPSRLIRSREVKYALIFYAASLSDDAWNIFSKSAIAHDDNLSDLFRERNIHISSIRHLEEKLDCSDSPSSVFYSARKQGKSKLVDRIYEMKDTRKMSLSLYDKVCAHLQAGNYRLIDAIANLIDEKIPQKDAKRILDVYYSDAELDEIPISDIYTKPPSHNGKEIAVVVENYDMNPFKNFVIKSGYDPELVESIVLNGFKINCSGKFIGMNYIPAKHVAKNVDRNNTPAYQCELDNTMNWLVTQGVITHHYRKGKSVKDGCVSINPHTKEIISPELRNYMEHVLFDA